MSRKPEEEPIKESDSRQVKNFSHAIELQVGKLDRLIQYKTSGTPLEKNNTSSERKET